MRQRSLRCFFVLLILTMIPILISSNAFAQREEPSRVEYFGGMLRQEFSFFTNSGDSEVGGLAGAYTTLEAEGIYRLADNVRVYGDLILFFDHIYNIRSNSDQFEKYNSSRKFMDSEIETYSEALEAVHELYFDIELSSGIDFRLGKQVVGWGETDGFRLTDIINPLDLSREFMLRDAGFDETRIPLWMAKSLISLPTFADFEELNLEICIIPDVRENKFYIGPEVGGVWAFPPPPTGVLEAINDSQYGLVLRPVNVPRGANIWLNWNERNTSLSNTEYALRLLGNYQDTIFTFNYFYGWSDAPVADLKSFAVGGTVVGPDAARNTRTRISGPPIDGAGNFLNAYIDMDYYRFQTVGFTLTRDMTELKWRGSSPVLRIESLYSFDQAFNTNRYADVDASPLLSGSPLTFNAIPKKDRIVKKDQFSLMVGFDYDLFLRWLNPRKSFWLSFQAAQFKVIDYDQKLLNAPYQWRKLKNEYWMSFMVDTRYKFDLLRLNAIFLRDWAGDCWALKPKCEYAFSDSWVGEIGAYFYEGKHSYRSIGLFDNNDSAYMRIKYQW